MTYRPEFVEVAIAPRVEGTCAWCGGAIRFPADESSAECLHCGAQSTRAIAPKRREPERVHAKAPPRAPVPARDVAGDLGPPAAILALLAIVGAIAALVVFPAIALFGTTGGTSLVVAMAALLGLGLILRK